MKRFARLDRKGMTQRRHPIKIPPVAGSVWNAFGATKGRASLMPEGPRRLRLNCRQCRSVSVRRRLIENGAALIRDLSACRGGITTANRIDENSFHRLGRVRAIGISPPVGDENPGNAEKSSEPGSNSGHDEPVRIRFFLCRHTVHPTL